MERVENTRQEILNIITSRKLTHEQKLTNLAGQADSLLEVLDLPDGLEELLEPVEGKQCICVNGRTFQVPKGKDVQVPLPVYEVLMNARMAEEVAFRRAQADN